MKNLKPVTYINSYYKPTTRYEMRQILLLKALEITNDPKKLQSMIGARNVADVYRTFDRLSMRKEYHRTLSKLGISFDYIANGIKKICDTADKEDVRLKGFQTLLKSLGLDSYRDEERGDMSGWEEVLMRTIDDNKSNVELKGKSIDADYDVKIPQIPESVKKQREIEDAVSKNIYE